MKVSDYRKDYYDLSRKASEAARTLSLSGLAIVWIFKVDGLDGPKLPPELLLPSTLIVLSLSLDLIQSAAGAAIWGWFARKKEKELGLDAVIDAHPACLNWPALAAFWLKLLAVALAYVVLLRFLIARLFCSA